MQKTALVIMAAGIGSRFGKGIKQLEPVGPSGEIIMEYSIFDALEAGFNKVVFIIRKDLENDFREVIGDRIARITEVEYVFQELDHLPEGIQKPDRRTKPWGTGQAILCCKDVVKEPFVVINADDYYGKEPFVMIHQHLTGERDLKDGKLDICMAGFRLKNTLSKNGGVTRGICRTDSADDLIGIDETSHIIMTADGAGVETLDGVVPVDVESRVSMNMWGLWPDFLEVLESGFREFLNNLSQDELKKEYLLPVIIDQLLKADKAEVKVLATSAEWFGVTYQEDKEAVSIAFKRLIEQGVYASKLFD